MIPLVEAFARKEMEGLPPSHDFLHADRVRKIALKIAGPDVDREVLEIACLLHDIGMKEELQGKGDHAIIGAKKAQKFLEGKLAKGKIEKIVDAIKNHRFSRGKIPKSLEGKILQDADRIDALGAIGIARVFLSAKGIAKVLYHPTDPFAEKRIPNDKEYVMDHFFTKLLKLPKTMNTEMGRKLAEERAQFMKAYLEKLKNEI